MDRDDIPTPNIGPRQCRRRLVGGLAGLAGAAVLVAILIVTDAGRWWRLLLIGPFTVAASGFLQYREKT